MIRSDWSNVEARDVGSEVDALNERADLNRTPGRRTLRAAGRTQGSKRSPARPGRRRYLCLVLPSRYCPGAAGAGKLGDSISPVTQMTATLGQ